MSKEENLNLEDYLLRLEKQGIINKTVLINIGHLHFLENNQLKKENEEFKKSKRFEVDFNGSLLVDIEIINNELKVNRAVNGYGNIVSPNKCKIIKLL